MYIPETAIMWRTSVYQFLSFLLICFWNCCFLLRVDEKEEICVTGSGVVVNKDTCRKFRALKRQGQLSPTERNEKFKELGSINKCIEGR